MQLFFPISQFFYVVHIPHLFLILYDHYSFYYILKYHIFKPVESRLNY